jgi:hypothetical protein
MTPSGEPARSSAGAAPRFAHLLLTRFNVRFIDDPSAPSIGVDPSWLDDRFGLFERYCLPTVVGQTQQRFSWLLFFDSATPAAFVDRVNDLAARHPQILPTFCESLPVSRVRQAVSEALAGEAPEWLLTTRLDNDDGVHEAFVQTVQDAQGFARAEVLNCPVGIILRGQRAYRRRDPSNAFISLSEPFSKFGTVLGIARHIYASESYPLRQVSDAALWLQVIHSKNVSNRVRGQRVRMNEARAGFACLAHPAFEAAESDRQILWENATLSLLRSARDTAVSAARRLARAAGVELRRKVRPAPPRSVST